MYELVCDGTPPLASRWTRTSILPPYSSISIWDLSKISYRDRRIWRRYGGDNDHIPTISGLRRHNMIQNISFRAQVRFVSMFIVTKECSNIVQFYASFYSYTSLVLHSIFMGQTYQFFLTSQKKHKFQMIISPNTFYSQYLFCSGNHRTTITKVYVHYVHYHSICPYGPLLMSHNPLISPLLIQTICNCMYSFNPTVILVANYLHCSILCTTNTTPT